MRGEVARLSVDMFLSYGPVRSVVFEAEIHPTKFGEKGRVRQMMKAGVRGAEERARSRCMRRQDVRVEGKGKGRSRWPGKSLG